MHAEAYAKINLLLAVRSPDESGLHPILSLTQSIGRADHLELTLASEDRFETDGAVPDDHRNLAVQAVEAVRARTGRSDRVAVSLAKRIPVAAGLGGGSADAAAALALSARLLGLADSELVALAPGLGSDVPFCLVGGTAMVSGRGEIIERLEPAQGYTLGIVVPPVRLGTPEVYTAWDRLGEPVGPASDGVALPPALRRFGPLHNDLYPAAIHLAPVLAEWHAELAHRWGGPVLLSGSGPALFGFFGNVEEAEEAVADIPAGARDAFAALPMPRGWEEGGGTLS